MAIHAIDPKNNPKKDWLKATFKYFTACVDSNPKDAEENIKNPAITSIKMEIKKGISTLIFFIGTYGKSITFY